MAFFSLFFLTLAEHSAECSADSKTYLAYAIHADILCENVGTSFRHGSMVPIVPVIAVCGLIVAVMTIAQKLSKLSLLRVTRTVTCNQNLLRLSDARP
jgi:hypothetical protein